MPSWFWKGEFVESADKHMIDIVSLEPFWEIANRSTPAPPLDMDL